MAAHCRQCGRIRHWTQSYFCSAECKRAARYINDWVLGRIQGKICKVCGVLFIVRCCEKNKYSTCGRRCFSIAKQRENNGNWQGGVTVGTRKGAMSLALYKEWRAAVMKRDDYRCQGCGKRGGDLNADHIQRWAACPSLRYAVSNGRTLCVPCHHAIMYYSMPRKLTDAQAREIVLRYRNGESSGALAKAYGVSYSLVQRMVQYKIYQHAVCDLFGKVFPRTAEEKLLEIRRGTLPVLLVDERPFETTQVAK